MQREREDDLPTGPEEEIDPRGTVVRTIENNPEAWRSWVDENAGLFRNDVPISAR